MEYEEMRELCRKELEKRPPEEIMEYAIAGMMIAVRTLITITKALNKNKQMEE